jgi:hypothetical protein
VLEVLDKVDKRLKNVEIFQQRPSQPTVISSKNRMVLVLPQLVISSMQAFIKFDLNLAEDANIASAFVSYKAVKTCFKKKNMFSSFGLAILC